MNEPRFGKDRSPDYIAGYKAGYNKGYHAGQEKVRTLRDLTQWQLIKHSYWYNTGYIDGEGYVDWDCVNCGATARVQEGCECNDKYCYQCGALMDGKEGEEE